MIYRITGVVVLTLALLFYGAWSLHTSLSVERTFNASTAQLWKLWNDPDSIQKWWGPKGYVAVVARNDVRPGGGYLWEMLSNHGTSVWNTGTYKEVVTDRKLVSTMSFSNERGDATPGSQVSVPGNWPDEITVVVEFSEYEGKSRVTVTELGIPLIIYPLSKLGWAQQFDKLQMLL